MQAGQGDEEARCVQLGGIETDMSCAGARAPERERTNEWRAERGAGRERVARTSVESGPSRTCAQSSQSVSQSACLSSRRMQLMLQKGVAKRVRRKRNVALRGSE